MLLLLLPLDPACACNPPPSPSHLRTQVPMFTASGLQVRFLKIIEKSNYQTVSLSRH